MKRTKPPRKLQATAQKKMKRTIPNSILGKVIAYHGRKIDLEKLTYLIAVSLLHPTDRKQMHYD